MTIHQCPKCDLRFDWKTELDDHCWHDHPDFRHEYPAHLRLPSPAPAATAHAEPQPLERQHINGGSFLGWLMPDHSHEPRNPG